MPEIDNGRITLAVLANKLDNMADQLDKIEQIVQKDHDCLTGIVKRNENADKKLETHDRDIEEIKRISNTWNGINSALAIAGSTVAAWLGLRSN